MQQSNHTIHAITGEQICPRKHNHDQTNREHHRGNGADETRSICLEPRGGVGGEGECASKGDETSAHEGVDKHFVNSHAGFFGADARDELGRLSMQHTLVEPMKLWRGR